jgi:nitroimidazol reductase NimA-like FMN-containing flavoprotein (pyridoxamine 5'-phosphate oxidase superfamily)
MTSDTYTPTPRTTPTRLRERVSYDREAVHAALDEAVLCHVAFVVDGAPVVLPQLHVRVGETLYLHGSTGARAMRESVADGLEVCVTVTHLDGLVLARSAFHHSANYRCVVVHGRSSTWTRSRTRAAQALPATTRRTSPRPGGRACCRCASPCRRPRSPLPTSRRASRSRRT